MDIAERLFVEWTDLGGPHDGMSGAPFTPDCTDCGGDTGSPAAPSDPGAHITYDPHTSEYHIDATFADT
jgi:hypothetical protein